MYPRTWLRPLSLVLFVAATLTVAAVAQQPAFKVLYAQRIDLNTTLKVMIGFGAGPPGSFAVDTGSVGVVAPKSELPKGVKRAVAGYITYTSSGLVVNGFWTEPIDIALDVSGAIAHVSVFAATDSHCVRPSSNVCHPGSLPHLLGIGFGRPDSYASPDRNPLINIRNLPAGVPSNYRITHTGIELGITNASSIPGLHTIRLAKFTRPGLLNQPVTDYKTPPGLITVNSGLPQNATILIDTGISDALIALGSGEPSECIPLPREPKKDCIVETGTRFRLSMLDGAALISFAFGDDGEATPSSGHWIHLNPREGSFMNTGIRPLAKFDVFYDYTRGVFGLNPASSET
jgi:hypothetical protein